MTCLPILLYVDTLSVTVSEAFQNVSCRVYKRNLDSSCVGDYLIVTLLHSNNMKFIFSRIIDKGGKQYTIIVLFLSST
jgi:hypothetical protein